MRLFGDFSKSVLYKIFDVLVPDEKRIRKLVTLDPYDLKLLLPRSPLSLHDATIFFDYRNKIVKLLVKSVKFKNNFLLRKRFAIFIADEIAELSSENALFEGSSPIIAAMPMGKKEKRLRGFNQCEEVLKEVKALNPNLGIFNFGAISKIRETKRQTELGRSQRIENVRHSMLADPKIVSGHPVIIMDDLYTTGATFDEAKRALRSAGSKSVYGIFLAH